MFRRLQVFLLLFSAARLPAQVASSSLLGDVRDESHAAAGAVSVTARNETTGFSRTVLTGPDGMYRIDELAPGAYTVSAGKQGFRTVTTRSVVLEVNQKARLDFELKVGSSSESITVAASVTPVQTDDASSGYLLHSETILNLPLGMRNVASLVTLGPGAIPRQLGGFTNDVISDYQGSRGLVALNPPINGARSTMNSYLLDGAVNTDRNVFAMAVNPPVEGVQEFRIVSSLAPAEFAQSGGGVVDVVTKTGGAKLHGSAFEYFRNEATDAHNFFDDPSLPRPILRQNQFGASAGGPLPLASTFFFANYEGVRGKAANSSLSIVPDATVRAGDFRGGAPIRDPLTQAPFPNNVIPSNRIDPVAGKYLAQYEPLPNTSSGSGNYLDATPNDTNHDSVSARIDHELRQHSRLFGRYTLNDERDRVNSAFPLRPDSERVRAQQAALGHTLAKASWLNEARFSFTRLRVFDVPQSAFVTDVAGALGVSGVSSDPFTWGLPYFLVNNYSTLTDDPTLPKAQRDNLWSFSDGISVSRGVHTIKLGAQWTHFQMNYLRDSLARGQFTYTGAFTGDPLGDFLLGYPQMTQRTVGSPQAYMRQNAYGAYIQDDWRITRSLTLNLGLRYEYTAPYTEARDKLLNLDYSTLPPKLIRVHTAVEPDRNNLASRVGLAWSLPSSRPLVFRAGYGVYYSPEIAIETYDLVLNNVRTESNRTDASTPILTTRDGFPQTASTGLPSYFGVDPKARDPYVEQWGAGFQRELPSGILLDISYLGTKGTRLGRFRQFNAPLAPGPGDLQSRRPFPELGPIIQRQNIASSIYHSLQIKAEKRLSSRLTFLGSFVWSKSIDDATGIIPGLYDSAGAQDERNLRLERALSFFNVGRRVSAAVVWNLPAKWQLSTVVTLQDGTPLDPIYYAADFANTGTPNHPNIVPGQSITLPRAQRTPERWFNTAAFSDPQPYTFGNAGRNIIPGPGNNVFDVAAQRRFRIDESKTLELRAEFFNVFNHPNFGIPGPYPDFGPFFGRIFATGPPRRGQFVLRFEF